MTREIPKGVKSALFGVLVHGLGHDHPSGFDADRWIAYAVKIYGIRLRQAWL